MNASKKMDVEIAGYIILVAILMFIAGFVSGLPRGEKFPVMPGLVVTGMAFWIVTVVIHLVPQVLGITPSRPMRVCIVICYARSLLCLTQNVRLFLSAVFGWS